MYILSFEDVCSGVERALNHKSEQSVLYGKTFSYTNQGKGGEKKMNFSLNMDEKASIYLHEINKETLNEQIPGLKWATVPSELLGDDADITEYAKLKIGETTIFFFSV